MATYKKWYREYLTTFEKPYESISPKLFEEVKKKLGALQSGTPLATVVVIAYNEDKRLFSCLWSLSDSKCNYPIEIIGIDNNSKDKTREIYKRIGLPYYIETNKSCGFARSRGLIEAKGKYYICIDSDTIYPEYYIQTLIDELEKKDVVAVTSTWSYVPSKKYPRFKMVIYEFVRDLNRRLLFFKSPERAVRGLVFAYRTDLGRRVGYRVQIIRGEDGSMAYGLKDYGKIKFITSSKARPVTSTGTIEADGSLLRAFVVRVVSHVKGIRKYIIKAKGELTDEPSNLVK